MIKFSFSGNCYQTQRVIGHQSGSPGPTIVFFGGVHGNEPSGVIALQQVFAELESNQIAMQGQVIGLAGNLLALAGNERFISRDLVFCAEHTVVYRRLDFSQQAILFLQSVWYGGVNRGHRSNTVYNPYP